MHAFHLAPNVSWCVDLFDVKVYHAGENKTICLKYPHAVIWDFMTREYPVSAMIRFLRVIGQMTPTHAEQVVRDSIDFFVAETIITRE